MRLFGEKCRPSRQLQPGTAEYLAIVNNYPKLPTIFILFSIFGSLSHHFKVHRVDNLSIQYFSRVRCEFIWEKSVGRWGRYGLKQGNPLIFLNHSQLHNIYFYDHFLVQFIIISRCTELIFYSFKVFLE